MTAEISKRNDARVVKFRLSPRRADNTAMLAYVFRFAFFLAGLVASFFGYSFNDPGLKLERVSL